MNLDHLFTEKISVFINIDVVGRHQDRIFISVEVLHLMPQSRSDMNVIGIVSAYVLATGQGEAAVECPGDSFVLRQPFDQQTRVALRPAFQYFPTAITGAIVNDDVFRDR